MSMPKNEIYDEMNKAWKTHVESLEKSINVLEEDISQAKSDASSCTGEWCTDTEHVIDDLNNALFSISEPRWGDPETTKRIKNLKRRVYDLYVNYKGVSEKVGLA